MVAFEPVVEPPFAQRDLWNTSRDHSGLMFAARITLLHFSVSLTMKVSKSAEEPANIALPRSERRAYSGGFSSEHFWIDGLRLRATTKAPQRAKGRAILAVAGRWG